MLLRPFFALYHFLGFVSVRLSSSRDGFSVPFLVSHLTIYFCRGTRACVCLCVFMLWVHCNTVQNEQFPFHTARSLNGYDLRVRPPRFGGHFIALTYPHTHTQCAANKIPPFRAHRRTEEGGSWQKHWPKRRTSYPNL